MGNRKRPVACNGCCSHVVGKRSNCFFEASFSPKLFMKHLTENLFTNVISVYGKHSYFLPIWLVYRENAHTGIIFNEINYWNYPWGSVTSIFVSSFYNRSCWSRSEVFPTTSKHTQKFYRLPRTYLVKGFIVVTHWPISGQCFNFIPPEIIRKSKIFWCFQGV